MAIFTALFLTISMIFFTASANASVTGQYNTREVLPIDAVLVLDVSRSMITADPDRIANSAMNKFIDQLEPSRDRVGIVAYAGHITYSSGLVFLCEENRTGLQNTISALEYASWTDHPLGLLEAINILLETTESEYRQPIIIFLTDGNLNVNPHGTRTTADAEYDKALAISLAKINEIPIFAIGLNFDGQLDRRYTETVANETGGIAFETAYAQDLTYILETIFSLMQYIQLPNEPIPDEIIEVAAQEETTYIMEDGYTYEVEEERTNRTPLVAGAAALMLLTLLLMKTRKPKRVFTGRLTIQIVAAERASETKNFNLIEYGRQIKLKKLLDTFLCKIPDAFESVSLAPSPHAPSHLPQLVLSAPSNKGVQAAINFLPCEELRSISISPGTDVRLSLPSNETEIHIRYA